MVFYSTTDTIETEKALQKKIKSTIIPTPREISKSCGFAIKVSNRDEDRILEAVKQVEVPHALYFLSEKDDSGVRTVRFIEGVSGKEGSK